jgi:hypothetical protein
MESRKLESLYVEMFQALSGYATADAGPAAGGIVALRRRF